MASGSDLHPLDTLRRLFGEDAALTLRKAFGGTRLHVPYEVAASHAISIAIGHERAVALATECGGVAYDIAKVPFRDRLRELAALDLTNKEVALRLGVSERHVYAQLRRYGLRRCDLENAQKGS